MTPDIVSLGDFFIFIGAIAAITGVGNILWSVIWDNNYGMKFRAWRERRKDRTHG